MGSRDPRRLKAVVLLSGGLDSYTAAAIAREEGFDLYALTVDYHQRHRQELDAARAIAHALDACAHLELSLDLRRIGGSALTDNIAVPKERPRTEDRGPETAQLTEDRGPKTEDQRVPVTYVPARNTIFLSLALAWGEVLGAHDLFIGVNALDYSGYPDCRPAYIAAFEQLANLGTKAGVEGRRFRVHTPLIAWSKAEIIRRGTRMGLDYSLTHSCYDPTPEGKPCGACESCRLRRKGFEKAGIRDPLTR